LEIKAQREAPREVHYPRGIVGRADAWIKFSLASPLVPKLETAIVSTGLSLVQVNKRRWLQRYSTDTGQPKLIAASDRPQEGCLCELTALEVGDRKFWTLGFEAFGPAEHVDEILTATASFVFAPEDCPSPLECRMSFPYPGWLLLLQSSGDRT